MRYLNTGDYSGEHGTGPALIVDGTIRAPTLASVIARRLEDEIVSQGWPVGEVLGSESELLERFGVSRAVFREAVRVVENTGAARMRRGPGGGLVVTEPNRSGVVAALSIWFSYVGVTIDEMVEARVLLLEGACELAASHPDRQARAFEALAHIGGLGPTFDARSLVDVEATVAGLAANPALSLFVEAIADLGISWLRSGRSRLLSTYSGDDLAAATDAYREVVRAVGAGQGRVAGRRMRQVGEALRNRLVDAGPTRRAGTPAAPLTGDEHGAVNPGKMAEAVAKVLRDHIEAAGWPVGEVLGSETELIDRLQVSRAILREAVRILEYHGAVKTKRGPGGGIVVCAPDSGTIVRSARIFLEYEGVTPINLSEARSVIEVAAAGLAAQRGAPDLEARLVQALEREGRSGDAAVSFGGLHHTIAEATGNRLLPLFVDVMGGLVPPHLKAEWQSPSGRARLSAEVHRTHQRLVRAILEGNPDEAARRMRRHMAASANEFA
jgi:DNA-binding FadR family transcriptional regulator